MKNLYLIQDEFINTRLDRWLKKKVCKVPQSLIEKNIRKGNIKVNGNKNTWSGNKAYQRRPCSTIECM